MNALVFPPEFFERVHGAVAVLHQDRRILFWNHAAEVLTGVPRTAAIGTEFAEFFDESVRPDLGAALGKADRGEAVTDVCLPLRGPDGLPRICRWNLSRLASPGEEPLTVAMGLDVTDRERVLSALRDSEERFQAVTRSAQDGIVIMHNDGTISSWNPAAENIFGYTAAEAVGKPLHGLLAPERLLPAHLAAFPRWQATGEGAAVGRTLELPARRRDGREISIELSLSSVQVRGEWQAIGIVRDVTARLQALAALQTSERQFRQVFETVQTGLLVVDAATHRVVECNPVACRLFGRSRDELIGQECHRFLCPTPRGRCPITDLGLQLDNAERYALSADGREIPILKTVVPIDLQGKACLLESFVDISQRVEAEREMRRARELAESANRAKSQFIANMSHELRTPLNAILGYSEMLQEDAAAMGNTSAVEDLGKIRQAGRHLLELINQVLDIARIEAGRLTVASEPVPVPPLLEAVRVTAAPLAQARGNSFAVSCDESAALVRGDPLRIRQILFNLVSNACKFTERGSVSLAVTRKDSPEGPCLHFAVTDTGIGISPEAQATLFQEFAQADESVSRRYGGTGLGLTISLRLARLMGGEIKVRSEPGKGSTFTLDLPAASPDPDDEGTPPSKENRE